MGNRSKYRKLTDLFVVGTEVVFPADDGPVVFWMQVLNPFEMQEARNDAQAVRGRITMAIKTIGSTEHDIALGAYLRRPRAAVEQELADNKTAEWYMDAQNEIDADPDWAEKLTVLRGADENNALPRGDEEEALLAQLNAEYLSVVNKGVADSRDFYLRSLGKLSLEEVQDEYMTAWIERRAQSAALAEFNLSELYLSARVCEAKPDDDGNFSKASHAKCDHRERAFESRDEVRSLPVDMQAQLRAGLESLAMTLRDAKNSDRQGSSSDSSPLPSPEEESTVSTSSETSSAPPGT